MDMEYLDSDYEALDVVFGKIDDMLLAGKFEQCDEYLASIEVALPVTAAWLLTVLTATLPAKGELKGREAFYLRVREELKTRGYDVNGSHVGVNPIFGLE